MGSDAPAVVLTDSAREVLERVRATREGKLSFVIGNGCCDSTAPYLFEDYLAGPNERAIGEAAGTIVLLDDSLERSFADTEVVIDAAPAPGDDSFSCESEFGYRFSLARLPSLPARS